MKNNIFKSLAFNCLALFSLSSLADNQPGSSENQFALDGLTVEYQIQILADNLNHPWSLAFLPDQSILISERGGHLKHWTQDKQLSQISGVPDTYVQGQGGFFDVAVHPEFVINREIFLAYADGDKKNNATSIIKAELKQNQLSNSKKILRVSPGKDTPVHYGGRIVVMPDNSLLLTTGDGFDYREDAQRLNKGLGKILRIRLDGSIPEDNPFIGQDNVLPEIYSYGHRNPQGLIYDPQRQKIFAHEHGPAGGDEINEIQAGNNYGWPVVTQGKDYSGASISPFTEYAGMQPPLLNWTPSIAPSGMAVYYGNQFPEIDGDFLVGALVDREVRLVRMKNSRIAEQISLFKELNARIRDVRVGNDGAIYLLTDSAEGQLLKVTRVNRNP